MKHALFVRLVRALQRKEKGFLCLDTHAGRGSYDLATAAVGDSLAREPEWPGGIGKLVAANDATTATAEYVSLIREFDRRQGNLEPTLRFYPGSPWIARLLLRPQDRLVLCEKHDAECAALRAEFRGEPGVAVHEIDGYRSLRAMLPPPERRALVLIDPPYEEQGEFKQITASLREGLQRLASGVFAVWYPLTERARVEEFFATVVALKPPPTLAAELTVAGENAPIKMKGSGLLVINPPWRFADEAREALAYLAPALAQSPGGGSRVDWLVSG
ncbi:MAG: 23S rRNA (adenine(2030)-N(6))-methyltransferase RlmJ [Opitutaceae bacterium]